MPDRHRIELAGVELRPDMSGALHVPEFAALIISDLHLEQGTSLARRGIRVPPYDTAITISLLESVVKRFAPQRLIFLGDSFHDAEGETRVEEPLMARLSAIAEGHECFWICGNHDPLPPQLLAGHAVEQLLLGPLTLRHEPKRLRAEEAEISGHLHPGCAVAQRGRRVSGKCFIADGRRLIMPAFGAYTGALSVFAEPYQRLFARGETQAWLIGQSRIYKFPLDRLC
ncbi:MAG: ligase-associated DNA damage response endonuclease PdeM [Alphaproteobacteria bacterium]|nr:ligase-associated DNA damage response endonuclease PdeM [Alphaproteobacteria bacterium]